jgi:HEAT repeat protein
VPLIIVAACVAVYAVFAFVVIHPRSASEWLVDLQSGGPSTRYHAALQLAQAIRRMKTPDPKLAQEVIKLFEAASSHEGQGVLKTEINMKAYLANCLGVLGDVRASGPLLATVRSDPDVQTRAACLEAVGAIKDPSTIPDLVKFLDDPDGVVRKYAALNLGAVAAKAQDRSVVEPLRKLLSDPLPDVGWNAALALGYFLGDPSGNDTLKKMLDRKYLAERIRRDDPQVESLTAQVLVNASNAAAKLKDPSFLPSLRALTDDKVEPNPDVRFIAHKAIAMIEGK